MTGINRNRQSGSALIGLIIAMAVVYFLLLAVSMRGWGYMGYGGYHRGPGIHHSPSTRDGSLGGPSNRGGGYSGGK